MTIHCERLRKVIEDADPILSNFRETLNQISSDIKETEKFLKEKNLVCNFECVFEKTPNGTLSIIWNNKEQRLLASFGDQKKAAIEFPFQIRSIICKYLPMFIERLMNMYNLKNTLGGEQ